MSSPGNVATPVRSEERRVGKGGTFPGLAPSATVTLLVKPVAVFSCTCRHATCLGGVIADLSTVLLGWTLKLSCVAAPAVMLNGVEVVPLRLPLLAVSV